MEAVVPPAEADAAGLEAQFVHRVYEEIADHFSDTRYKVGYRPPARLSWWRGRLTGALCARLRARAPPPQPWPVVDAYLRGLEAGAVVADVGCGNGKYMGVNPAVLTIGCDRYGG